MKLSLSILCLAVYCLVLAVGCNKADSANSNQNTDGKAVDVKGGPKKGGKKGMEQPEPLGPPPK